jgi:orotate phosphoribosyltransferase
MRMRENPVHILIECQAIRVGHFVLAGKEHSSVYLEKEEIFSNVEAASVLCSDLAMEFFEERVETVLGLESGGSSLASWTAKFLGLEYKFRSPKSPGVRAAIAHKDKDHQGNFIIRPAYARRVAKRRVLIVDDITTTGESLKKTIEAVRSLGGEIIGAAVISNRGTVSAELLGVPKFHSLMDAKAIERLGGVSLDTWTADECPLCEERVPINTEVGHGKEFLDGNERTLSVRTAAIAAGTATPSDIAALAETRQRRRLSDE